jgi:hypothetical protein
MCWMLVRALHKAGRVPLIRLSDMNLQQQQGMGLGFVRAAASSTAG